MSWSALFTLTNVVAFAGWAVLAFLPRARLAQSAVMFGCVGLLCLAYAAMFVALFGGLVDPARVAGAPPPDLTNYSVEGLRALFMLISQVVNAILR